MARAKDQATIITSPRPTAALNPCSQTPHPQRSDVNVSFGSIYYRALADTKVDTTVTSVSFTVMSRYLIMV
jgi:hypothetical protein